MTPWFFPSFGGVQPQARPKPRPIIAEKRVFGGAGAGKSGKGRDEETWEGDKGLDLGNHERESLVVMGVEVTTRQMK